jgi:hypothetical protein
MKHSFTVQLLIHIYLTGWLHGSCEPPDGHPVRLISLVARPTIFNYHFLTRR